MQDLSALNKTQAVLYKKKTKQKKQNKTLSLPVPMLQLKGHQEIPPCAAIRTQSFLLPPFLLIITLAFLNF